MCMCKSAFTVIVMFLMLAQGCSDSPITAGGTQNKSLILIAPAMFLHKNSAPGLQGFTDAMDLLTDNGMNVFGFVADWKDLEPSPGEFILKDPFINPLTLLVPKYPQLKGVVLVLKMIDTNLRTMTEDLQTKPFDDPEVLSRFDALIAAIAAEPSSIRVTHILLGNEVEGYLSKYPEEIKAFSVFYQRAVASIHKEMPSVRVGTIISFLGVSYKPRIFDELIQFSDFIAYTYYPVITESGKAWQMAPVSVIKDHIDFMAKRAGNKQFAFTEIGYSSSPINGSSEELQAEFVREMFRALDPYEKKGHIAFLLYHALYDYPPDVCTPYAEAQGVDPIMICAFMNNLGLRSYESGEPRKAWNVFVQGVRNWLSDSK